MKLDVSILICFINELNQMKNRQWERQTENTNSRKIFASNSKTKMIKKIIPKQNIFLCIKSSHAHFVKIIHFLSL